MQRKRAKKKRSSQHPLVGSWVNGDEYATDVEYIVSRTGAGFVVRAIDRHDGEEADVYEIKWDGEVLSFATHWNSTGRFARCRLQAVSQDRVAFTYTYTDSEMWHRKSA